MAEDKNLFKELLYAFEDFQASNSKFQLFILIIYFLYNIIC